MKIYLSENEKAEGKKVALDDLMLTADMPTTAGSKMLDGYKSLFGADVIDRLSKAGYSISGKLNTGEFGIDVLGETSYFGACKNDDGTLAAAASLALKDESLTAAVCLDVTGTVRRAAAVSGLVSIKPTYGTVSRFGTIPVACSGETVSVMAVTAEKCSEVLDVIAGHDDKDGTSLPDDKCALVKSGAAFTPIKKVALAKSLISGADAATIAKIDAFRAVLAKNGIETEEIDDSVLKAAGTAWNILMNSELCNNVSRYDGVKYGYRSKNYRDIDELYTNSRTESFGELLKIAVLAGSENLSTDNYMKYYDKALRVRRVICEKFAGIFNSFDAVLMPACSKASYTEEDVKSNLYLAFDENIYTAPASITGLPAVVAGGVQLVGSAFSENALLAVAALVEKEGK